MLLCMVKLQNDIEPFAMENFISFDTQSPIDLGTIPVRKAIGKLHDITVHDI